jgi:glutamate 5-kinase
MATVTGPHENPHGVVVVVMSAWEAECLAYVLSDVQGKMQDDPELHAIARAFERIREDARG